MSNDDAENKLVAKFTTCVTAWGKVEDGDSQVGHATSDTSKTLCGRRVGEVLWGRFCSIEGIPCLNCQRVARRLLREALAAVEGGEQTKEVKALDGLCNAAISLMHSEDEAAIRQAKAYIMEKAKSLAAVEGGQQNTKDAAP